MQTLLSHTVQGKGKPVLLLHGFCESQAIWNGFIPALSEQYTVITVDLGGFGESTALLPKQPTIEALAEQVYRLVDKLRIKRLSVVAHSLGGYVALALAEAHPKRLKGLCLFHSTALPDTPEKQSIRNNVIEFVQKNGVEPFIQNFVSPLFYSQRHHELESEINFVKNIALKTPKETIITITQAMRDRKDRTHVLASANYPIGFVIGKQDQAVLYETYLSQIGLAKHTWVQILDDTAHMGMLERPKETLQFVQNFLAYCTQKS
ncbi:MAG: alpha/beta hydrolase [Microscillaceae bacterium]|nr:alpha/beta hydrolase [Microscillaceae bacterium]MDW8461196.1 alpha/beta hydrolase [Cytophagales bacterium]